MITEQPKADAPGQAPAAGAGRRGRRYRGRRRPRGARPPDTQKQTAAEPLQAGEQNQTAPSASHVSLADPVATRKESQAEDMSPIRQAIQHVDQIIESLQEALDDMEHVLKVLHEAERQKSADEQELESLRQKLNKLQRGKGE